LELHVHGGHATVKAVLAAIGKCQSKHTIRYAEAGEFTRRAFQNDRLDLGQVEALSDALSADTEQQRRAALRGNSGKLGRIYEEWRQLLLAARGELEALIDFSEDQHFDDSPAELMENVTRQIGPILSAIRRHQAGSRCGELLKRGIRISFLGPPNAGKSSLLNIIVDREASIVSEEAGTTRDIVEVSVDIGGYLCVFADTAGLRASASVGGVEQEGIKRAKAKAKESDLVSLFSYHNSHANRAGTQNFDLRMSHNGLVLGVFPVWMCCEMRAPRVYVSQNSSYGAFNIFFSCNSRISGSLISDRILTIFQVIVLASVEQLDQSNPSVYQLASEQSGLSTFCTCILKVLRKHKTIEFLTLISFQATSRVSKLRRRLNKLLSSLTNATQPDLKL
jgi:tRNA U34 5-carboxymethylaminomethyl modifying GTPase MnmE/TrmE